MLFDLRSRGRRSAIKVIYSSLAILMGAGLILFGIGGSVSGGLIDAFQNDSQSTSDVFKDKVKAAEKRVEAQPQNAPAWANLAKVRYQAASAGSGFDDVNGVFTEDGKKDLAGVEQAWDKYLALKPEKIDVGTAKLMVIAFGQGALEDYDKAVAAQEAVIDQTAKPSAGLYVTFAGLAYLAGQNRKGDLAGEKAEELAASKTQRETIKANIAQLKQLGAQQALQQAQQQSGVSTDAQQLPGG